MKFRHIACILGLAAAAALQASAATTNDPVLSAAIDHERLVLEATLDSKPIVETYLQYTRKGQKSPDSDGYAIAQVGTSHRIETANYRTKQPEPVWRSIIDDFVNSTIGRTEEVDAAAFTDMVTPDPTDFNDKTYRFEFDRREFLGHRRTSLYDVVPADRHHEKGRFIGRIWVDDQDKVIVRTVGVFLGRSTKNHPEYLHFDSWRKQVPGGRWVPYAVYFEDNVRGSIVRGQVRLWGYKLRRFGTGGESDLADIQVENAQDESDESQDVSPLKAEIAWRKLAEDNVTDRLETAGVLAPVGDFEKVLNQIVLNLELGSNIDLPVQCRVMLTLPVEATVADRTILLSKGLVDTIPSEEALASVLALELAHIQLSHRLDTKYAFSDRLIFDNPQTYLNIRMTHSDEDIRAAADLAAKILAASIYKGKLSGVSAYYAILADTQKHLPSLTHAYLGDSLVDSDGLPWLAKALPSVNLQDAYKNAAQAPLPLSSSLATAPLTDVVSLIIPRIIASKPEDIHPFQVLPVYLNLQQGQPSRSAASTKTNPAMATAN